MSEDLFPVTKIEGRAVQRIKCDRCGATDHNSCTTGRAGTDTLIAFFRRRGWRVEMAKRERFVCASCQLSETVARRQEKEAKKMNNVVSLGNEGQPSQSSALAKKIMGDLLFEHYDLSARDYKPGWSDARIASESNLSENFVAQRRAQDYGPIPPPKPPIEKIALNNARDIIAAMRDLASRADAIKTRCEDVLKSAESIVTAFGGDAKRAAS